MVERLGSGHYYDPDLAYCISAWVADFQDPGDALTVWADLSPVGGDVETPMFDDGEHMDGAAADDIFGCCFQSDHEPGDYTITLYAQDPEENPMENDVVLTLIEDSSEPWIEVLSPNGGEVLESGFDFEITWDSALVPGNVHIEYSKDDFVSDSHYIGPNEPNDGSFLWEDVPNDPSDTVRIRIRSFDDPTIFDLSDDYFSIVEGPEKTITVTSPNGGEEWITGYDYEITWTSENISGTVGLAYSKDNFVSDLTPIAVNEVNDGSFMWHVPLDPCTEAWVRLISEDDPLIYDISDDPFSIIKDPDDPCQDFKEIRSGMHSNADVEMEIVVRSEEEWEAKLGWFSPMPHPPNVNWDEEMVIFIAYGERNSSGYYIEVNDICLDDAWVLHVDYDKWYPGPNCIVLWVITQPFMIVKTDTYAGQIVFDQHYREDPCK